MLYMLLVPTEENLQNAKRKSADCERQLAQIAQGSTEALEDLYETTKSSVYGFALSFVKNKHTAEDIMQDTYLTIYYKANTYRPLGKPLAWIMAIVRNLCLMKLRQDKTGETPVEDEDLFAESEEFVENTLDRMVLQAALTILTSEERQIVMLHCVAGLKHREIAELMKLPTGTVLSKYHRTLLKLQNNLKEEA